MEFQTYKGIKVFVDRVFKVGRETFVDLRDPRNGHMFKGISYNEFKNGARSREIVFENKGSKSTFIQGSKDYETFVKDNKLNPVFIDNCLQGISKTHKGYKIYYK